VRVCNRLGFVLYDKLGSETEAIAIYRKAVALLEAEQLDAAAELPDALAVASMYGMLGDILGHTAPQEGLEFCQKGLQLLEPRLSPTHRPAALLSGLASSYGTQAKAYQALAQREPAVRSLRKAVQLYEELIAAHPGVASYQFDLGSFYNNLSVMERSAGHIEQARASLKKAVEIKEHLALRYPDVPDYQANLVRSLASLSLDTMDQTQARTYQHRAELLARELNRLRPGVAQYQRALANSLEAGAELHQRANQTEDALVALDQAIDVWDKLVQTTDVAMHRAGLTQACVRKSLLASQAGKPELAAEAMGKAASRDPSNPGLCYRYGTALLNANRPKEATLALSKAVALKPDYAEAQCNLGLSLVRQGRFREGRDALRRGDELGRKQSGWQYPSAQWVRIAERLIRLDSELPTILAGKAEPGDSSEEVALGQLCQQYRRLHFAAARFYANAFATDPKLAADLRQLHRYNAACSAALAAAGQGEDAQMVPDRARLMLQHQALTWLRADLAAYAKLAERPEAAARQFVRQQLTHWQQDTDLASVRDQAALDTLPGDERQQWRQLWDESATLLKKLDEKK
jgi:tetratricopeptide (TPR) repeat protein